MAFYVIVAAPDLSAAQRRMAARMGPLVVLSRRDHVTMMRAAGFADVEEADVTADYRQSLQSLLDWSADHAPALRDVLGDELFEERQHDRRLQLGGVDRGLLRRSLIVAGTG